MKIETRNTPHKRKSFVLVRRFPKTAIWPVIDIHAKQAIEEHSFTKNIGSCLRIILLRRLDLDQKRPRRARQAMETQCISTYSTFRPAPAHHRRVPGLAM